MVELKVDPERWAIPALQDFTNIYIRAKLDDKWVDADLATLTKESLVEWLEGIGPVPSDAATKLHRTRTVLFCALGHRAR